ncbi:hypothetical protein I4U23_016056 [Adineta vaga]|nr:hypothetical protein I4U23_016056 [Adineta vaga]
MNNSKDTLMKTRAKTLATLRQLDAERKKQFRPIPATPENINHTRDSAFRRSSILTKTDQYDPRRGTVRNSNIPLADDCALRAFTVETVSYIQPNASRSNWTALSESALQMNECRGQKPFTIRKSFESMQITQNKDRFRAIFCL